jgi:hypothetical protein
MSYKKHAELEFKAAGWVNQDGSWNCEMQKSICDEVVELIEVFSNHDHSGTTAPYAIDMFKKLASFEPLCPLTGEEWEWSDVSNYGCTITYQNKRCSHVFKDADGRAYDINGKVFWEWSERPLEEDEEGYPGVSKFKSHYTSIGSKVYVDFPYTPSIEYIERESGCDDDN